MDYEEILKRFMKDKKPVSEAELAYALGCLVATNEILNSTLDDRLANSILFDLKLGQEAWLVRTIGVNKCTRKGIISEIHIVDDYRTIYVLKGIGRGELGKEVFRTKKDAEEMKWLV